MTKGRMNSKQKEDTWRSELDVATANRARLTASLREQRLKRDAETAATEVPVTPKKRGAKQKQVLT
jgi:hypothetical protein